MTAEMEFLLHGPKFVAGQEVVCINASGYCFLQEGKQYTIETFVPRESSPTFTWPAYVLVETQWGKVRCHASRFKACELAKQDNP